MSDIKVLRQNIEKNRRVLVTSDIHGHYEHLKRVLEMARFSEDDFLIVVGDVVEKGPESLKALRYVMELCRSGRAIMLLGNVDIFRVWMTGSLSPEGAEDFYKYLLHQREWATSSTYDEMAEECGVIINSAQDALFAKELIMERFKEEFDFLVNLPTVLETENYIFVHGGLPRKDLDDTDGLNAWNYLKYDNFMTSAPVFDKYVVVGHWPVMLYGDREFCHNPVINREKKIISIDGGCGIKRDGQLNLIELPSIDCHVDDIKMYSWDDLPTVVAERDQEGSTDPIGIKWPDNYVSVLEEKDDVVYVEHKNTSRRLWIPREYLYAEDAIEDCSDYILPVKKGDILKIVKKTSIGCIAKKDGVVGWYCEK